MIRVIKEICGPKDAGEAVQPNFHALRSAHQNSHISLSFRSTDGFIVRRAVTTFVLFGWGRGLVVDLDCALCLDIVERIVDDLDLEALLFVPLETLSTL